MDALHARKNAPRIDETWPSVAKYAAQFTTEKPEIVTQGLGLAPAVGTYQQN